MKIIATPLCMTSEYYRKVVENGFGFNVPIGIASDYDERLAETHVGTDALEVCERVWERFQNLSEDHACPDGDRSMMVGDLIRLEYEDGSKGHFIVAAMGFNAVDEGWMF